MKSSILHRVDNILNTYIAKKVIDDILNLKLAENDDFYILLNTNSTLQFLRNEISKHEYSNKIYVFANIILSEKTRPALKELCISICKELIFNKQIKDALFTLYKSKQISYSLIYTMLEYDDLDISIHQVFFEYLKENWQSFLSESKHNKNVIDIVEQRVERSLVPITKYWIYWCTVLHSNDKEGVLYFINNINMKENNGLEEEMVMFMKEVIEFLKTKLKTIK